MKKKLWRPEINNYFQNSNNNINSNIIANNNSGIITVANNREYNLNNDNDNINHIKKIYINYLINRLSKFRIKRHDN